MTRLGIAASLAFIVNGAGHRRLIKNARGCRGQWALLFLATIAFSVQAQLTISPIAPQQVCPGCTLVIPFQISGVTSSSTNLSIFARSSDQSLIRDQNISIPPGSGETLTNRTLILTAEIVLGGTLDITLTVSDGVVTNSLSFPVTVMIIDPVRPHTNSQPIIMADASVASPYPSTISLSGIPGKISKLTITLYKFSHSFPSDVGVLLVGPNGQSIVLMNRAGGGQPAISLDLTFDQAALGQIPFGPLMSGVFAPSDYAGSTRTFFSPAPAGPYDSSLDVFNGTNPNGEWSVYIQDFQAPDSGSIESGWGLAVTTYVGPNLFAIRDGDFLKLSVNDGPPNAIFTLQSTSDFKDWTSIESTNLDFIGAAQFQTQLTNTLGHQFYRVLSQ